MRSTGTAVVPGARLRKRQQKNWSLALRAAVEKASFCNLAQRSQKTQSFRADQQPSGEKLNCFFRP